VVTRAFSFGARVAAGSSSRRSGRKVGRANDRTAGRAAEVTVGRRVGWLGWAEAMETAPLAAARAPAAAAARSNQYTFTGSPLSKISAGI